MIAVLSLRYKERQVYKMAYIKEEKYELRYAVPTAEGNWNEKRQVYGSKEHFERNKAKCKELGYKVIKACKLYPFNTYKNQHNFELINNICHNTMWDMDMGEIEYNEAKYNELYERQQKAERFFCMPLPVAWVCWEDWQEMNEMATAAVLHRQNACIANGRPELVSYC